MYYILLESQLRKIIFEQTSPFYSQPKDYMGRKDHNSDYVFNPGGPDVKPIGAIDAKILFPNGQFTKTVSAKKVKELLDKNLKLDPNFFKFKSSFQEMVAILFNARDISWSDGIKKDLFNSENDIKHFAAAILNWVSKNKGYDPKILIASITIIFRESKASAASFLSPKEIYGWVLNLFGGEHSQGFAQVKPSTAKSYGIDFASLYQYEGSLTAAYKILSVNYQIAKKYYFGDSLTIFDKGEYKIIKALNNDAALEMAVASYNAGVGIINQWCKTNIKGIANICSINQRKDIYQKGDGIVAITNKSGKIPNYFPNIGGVHKYIPQFRAAFDSLSELMKVLLSAIPPSPEKR